MGAAGAATAQPVVVTVGMLAAALGVQPQRLRRWADRGRAGAPQQPRAGAHRRWSLPEAVAILRTYGKAVPEAWGA